MTKDNTEDDEFVDIHTEGGCLLETLIITLKPTCFIFDVLVSSQLNRPPLLLLQGEGLTLSHQTGALSGLDP